MNEQVKFVKVKCQCGHVNLVPVTEVFHVYENIKCEKCGRVIVEPKELMEFGMHALKFNLSLTKLSIDS